MDKHYGWQEGRGSQVPQGRAQNGQRWNERYRGDDRDMRSTRGGEYGGGWDQDDRQWTPSGGNLDREDYVNEGDEYGSQRGSFRSRGQQWTQSAGDQNRWSESGGYNRGQRFGNQGYGSQGFSGGHYGGFANEGARNQSSGGQREQNYGGNYGETFGRGYAGRGFSGRGPKGYQRSDERIKELLSERLTDDDDIDASEISIEVKNGEATLTGTVGSREEKRAAEELAERSPGVREVQNHLRVTQDSSSWSGQSKSRTNRE